MLPNYMVKNILIIDDSLEIQQLLRLLLESRGYHIDCTSNGEEALTLLGLSENVPDVILLDLQMPVMGGLSFLRSRQNDAKLRDIPIVLMSGEDDVINTGKLGHVADVLKKPFNMVSVLKSVERTTRLH